jgi:lipoyl(octanoyl) transferase
MAGDGVLWGLVPRGAPPTLRFYRWEPACVSLGRNQRLAPGLEGRLSGAGIGLVRRPTGGRGVLHDEELTYSVAVGDRGLGPPRAAYRRINEVLLDGVNRLGASASLQERSTPGLGVDRLEPCFSEPAEGEVLAGSRKLIGSAQVRVAGHLLQHGSLPLRRRAAEPGAGPEVAEHIGAPAYLETVITPLPPIARIVDSIVAAWREGVGPVELSELTDSELRNVEIVEARYRSTAWTRRR